MIYEELELKQLLFIEAAKEIFEKFQNLQSFTLHTHLRRLDLEVSYFLLPMKMILKDSQNAIIFHASSYDNLINNFQNFNLLSTQHNIQSEVSFSEHQKYSNIWFYLYEKYSQLSLYKDIQKHLKNNYITVTFDRDNLDKSRFDFLGENLYNKYKSKTMYDRINYCLPMKKNIHKQKI